MSELLTSAVYWLVGTLAGTVAGCVVLLLSRRARAAVDREIPGAIDGFVLPDPHDGMWGSHGAAYFRHDSTGLRVHCRDGEISTGLVTVGKSVAYARAVQEAIRVRRRDAERDRHNARLIRGLES